MFSEFNAFMTIDSSVSIANNSLSKFFEQAESGKVSFHESLLEVVKSHLDRWRDCKLYRWCSTEIYTSWLVTWSMYKFVVWNWGTFEYIPMRRELRGEKMLRQASPLFIIKSQFSRNLLKWWVLRATVEGLWVFVASFKPFWKPGCNQSSWSREYLGLLFSLLGQ